MLTQFENYLAMLIICNTMCRLSFVTCLVEQETQNSNIAEPRFNTR